MGSSTPWHCQKRASIIWRERSYSSIFERKGHIRDILKFGHYRRGDWPHSNLLANRRLQLAWPQILPRWMSRHSFSPPSTLNLQHFVVPNQPTWQLLRPCLPPCLLPPKPPGCSGLPTRNHVVPRWAIPLYRPPSDEINADPNDKRQWLVHLLAPWWPWEEKSRDLHPIQHHTSATVAQAS